MNNRHFLCPGICVGRVATEPTCRGVGRNCFVGENVPLLPKSESVGNITAEVADNGLVLAAAAPAPGTMWARRQPRRKTGRSDSGIGFLRRVWRG